MLEREFKYYIDNQDELVKQYDHKYIVIVGDTVVGSYDEKHTAYYESVVKYAIGTFLIQHCCAGDDAHTTTYHGSRVQFPGSMEDST